MSELKSGKIIGKWVYRILVLLIILFLVRSCFEMDFRFARVETGMPRAEVIAAMGQEPRLVERELLFCQGNPDQWSWLGDCAGARSSGAVGYLIWKWGPDTYFVVGLDREDMVVFKSRGDI